MPCMLIIIIFAVTKTNLAVHEDKNRVPFVKVRPKLKYRKQVFLAAIVTSTGISPTLISQDYILLYSV